MSCTATTQRLPTQVEDVAEARWAAVRIILPEELGLQRVLVQPDLFSSQVTGSPVPERLDWNWAEVGGCGEILVRAKKA